MKNNKLTGELYTAEKSYMDDKLLAMSEINDSELNKIILTLDATRILANI